MNLSCRSCSSKNACLSSAAIITPSVILTGISHISDNHLICTTGRAVPDLTTNPGLVSDCEALLAARDAMAGTATLNWSFDTPIALWEGVTTRGEPRRVMELDLTNRAMNGKIPAELGDLANMESPIVESPEAILPVTRG